MDETTSTVKAGRHKAAGLLLMDRPRALNALDLPMIEALRDAIEAWRDDPAVRLVVLEGAGGRAFCAGGDVRHMRSLVLAGDTAEVRAFFAAEYGVNAAIAGFGKPWVSLIDGVCMGGGIGVSVHGSHRVVTEAAMLAMPETAIALFPDVGTSHVLPRLPFHVGMWLALTGARLHGAQAVEAGLATHLVRRDRLAELRAALLAGDAAVVDAYAEPIEDTLPRAEIARCFGGGDVPAILAALAAEGTEWAAGQLATLRRASPTSLCVTHELLRRGAGLDLAGCLAMELALTRRVTVYPDFAEGVRAVLVDKDGAPRWTPARVEDVDPAVIAALFAA